MGERPDDLVPLFGGSGGDAGPVRWGQGVVVSWNTLTAENVINFRGKNLSNLPIVASSSEVLAMKPGDVVGLNIIGSGAAATVYIVGRITMPGTAQAASFMDLFGLETATENTQGNALTLFNVSDLGDLQSPANPGPAVTVTVGQTGRVLVLIRVEIVSSRGTVGFKGGNVGIQVSGANSVSASDQIGVGWNKYNVTADAGAIESWLFSGAHVYTGLNTGATTFKLRYGRSDSNCDCAMKNRTIMALPL